MNIKYPKISKILSKKNIMERHALAVIKIYFKNILKQCNIASMTKRYNNGIGDRLREAMLTCLTSLG